MKTTSVFLFVLLPFLTVSGTARAVETAFIPAPKPTRLEDIPTSTTVRYKPKDVPIPSIGEWAAKEGFRIVGDPELVVVDGVLTGMKVSYKKGSPEDCEPLYKRFPDAILLKPGIDEKALLTEVWKKSRDGLDINGNMHPFALGIVEESGQRIAYGICYLRRDQSARYDSTKKRFSYSFATPALQIRQLQKFGSLAPFPDIVLKQPELIIPREIVEKQLYVAPRDVSHLEVGGGKVEVMPAFVSMAELLIVQPAKPTNLTGGKIESLQVGNFVNPALHRLGVDMGDTILEIQGINPAGLTEAEYDKKMSQTSVRGGLRIVFRNNLIGKRTAVTIIFAQQPNTVAANAP